MHSLDSAQWDFAKVGFCPSGDFAQVGILPKVGFCPSGILPEKDARRMLPKKDVAQKGC